MNDIAQLEKAKRRAESKDNLREVANFCNLLGQEYLKDGDYEEALSQHKEEASLCSALEDTIGLAVANRRIGEVYCEMGQWDKALRYQHRHLAIAKEAKSLVEEQRAHATIGRTHLQRSEVFGVNGQTQDQMDALAESERSFLSSLSVCKSLEGSVDVREHSEMRCRLYLNLGLVLECRGNDKEARKLIGQALELSSSHGLYEDALRCHTALGGIYLRGGDLAEALQEGQRALHLSVKLHDKALQCDHHCFLAQVHLHSSDYEAAKKSFYRAYKLKHPSLEDRKRNECQLKVVVNLCETENALILFGDSQQEEKLKLFEKFGDGLCKLGLFSKAIDYYHLMLKHATELKKEPSFLAPIYLSLGQTYSDNKDYERAIEYYMKEYEIKINEDAADACRTLISIAITYENKGNSSELESIYEKARKAAVKASNKKLEYKVLKLHSALSDISESKKLILEEQMKLLVDENDLDPDAETSEEECENEEDIDLDLLYFSDSENDHENFDRSQQPRQRKTLAVRRNEKGETALHKACIAGNLSMVKRLLKQGHPVNPRDNCGWLPLHEAANHGFCDIVNVLLDAGASINDRGGKYCDGITPIHDAAACGNLSVVRLLMSRGASVIVKANDGSTPYECLVKYRQRVNLSKSDKEECFRLEAEMKDVMSRVGHKVPSVTPRASSHQSKRTSSFDPNQSSNGDERGTALTKGRRSLSSPEIPEIVQESSSRRTCLQYDSENDLPDVDSPIIEEETVDQTSEDKNYVEDDIDDSEEFFVNPLLEDIEDKSTSATGAYISAMGRVGSALRRGETQNSSSSWVPVKKDKKAALVTNVEDVGDDWLDDDLGVYSKKRKRMDKFEYDYKAPRKDKKVTLANSSEKPLTRKKPRQTKLTTLVQSSSVINREPFDDASNISGDIVPNRLQCDESPYQSNLASQSSNVNNGGKVNAPVVNSGSALRLKVRVQNRLLLVPVAGASQERTVGWLAEEVTRRYYQLSGMRPHLTLTTQDGAVLDANDPISLVLSSEQAELQAQVTGWDLPPLPERYTQACQALGTVPASCLVSLLRQAESTMTVDLSRMVRLNTQLHPVIRAIQCQQSLHTLVLSNCRLGDNGFKFLMETLPSLPSLEVLDLKVSSLTVGSLLSFTEAITSKGLDLKTLASLDLSYNNFCGAKVSDLLILFSLSSLQELSLKHCYLSLTDQQQLPVTPSNVKKLFLDFNTIYESPLTLLLSCIPQVTHLSLSGLNCKSNITVHIPLGVALSSVLGAGEECLLQSLDLSSCSLTDADLDDISAYLYRCPHLISVNLSHNKLSPLSVNAFLNEVATNILIPLKSLSLHGINSSEAVHTKLVSTLHHKATTQNALTKLSVSQQEFTTDNHLKTKALVPFVREIDLVKAYT
ncbi:hypothetical protein SK128_015394 [Halocaridina rubra]|uniref:Tonsoku-like protein n=1 Tax=Halocaridina rubra TaxID=373956 RepID=A0AAN8X9X7_HALRR